MLALPAPTLAAGVHPVLVQASVLGSIWHAITGVVLGAFTWTIKLAGSFILDTLGGLVRLLIPRSWAHEGAQIMAWIVAVPDYAGKITAPSGGHQYGFAGINDLRDLFMWLGVAIAPLTLTHAAARSMFGDSEPVAIPVLRVVGVAVAILTYPYWWAQAAALTDQITHLILNLPSVTSGLQKLMDYAVDGVALGGWQLIDLALMAAIGLELLGLIFLKVTLILLGALLYATGPLMIGLVPTRFGHAIARAWLSAVLFLLVIGIGWATIFAVGALLIEDAGTAGPLIAGNSSFGSLIGGLIVAIAGAVALWVCLKAAKEAGSMLRMQLGGLLALSFASNTSSATATTGAVRQPTTAQSIRGFGAKLAGAASGVGTELAGTVPGGRSAQQVLSGAGYVGRRGVLGTAAAGTRYAGAQTTGPSAAMLKRSRAGAVAVRMAKAGTAGWGQAGSANGARATDRPAADPAAPATAAAGAGAAAAAGRRSSPDGSAPPAAAQRSQRQTRPRAADGLKTKASPDAPARRHYARSPSAGAARSNGDRGRSERQAAQQPQRTPTTPAAGGVPARTRDVAPVGTVNRASVNGRPGNSGAPSPNGRSANPSTPEPAPEPGGVAAVPSRTRVRSTRPPARSPGPARRPIPPPAAAANPRPAPSSSKPTPSSRPASKPGPSSPRPSKPQRAAPRPEDERAPVRVKTSPPVAPPSPQIKTPPPEPPDRSGR